MITFMFLDPKNSATQTSPDQPCTQLAGGECLITIEPQQLTLRTGYSAGPMPDATGAIPGRVANLTLTPDNLNGVLGEKPQACYIRIR